MFSGSKITLGLTEEQKDQEMEKELEKRRVEARNFRWSLAGRPSVDPADLKPSGMANQDEE